MPSKVKYQAGLVGAGTFASITLRHCAVFRT
jgi:hypothetical protein